MGDAELDTMIEKRADELAQQLDAERSTTKSSSGGGSNRAGLGRGLGGLAGALGSGSGAGAGAGGDGRGTITVQFFEKKRRKAWYGGRDEEVCWESWTLKVTVAEPRTESGEFDFFYLYLLYLLLFFHSIHIFLLLLPRHYTNKQPTSLTNTIN